MFTAMDRIRVRLLDVAAHQGRRRPGQGRADRDRAQSDPGPRARDHARDLPRGSGDQAPQRGAAGHHRPVRRQHRPRAAQSAGRRGVVALSAAPAPRRAGAARPRSKKHLDRIGSEVQRANKTIHDLLDLARNRPPRRHRTGLRALVDSAAEAALLPAAITLRRRRFRRPDRQHRSGPGAADPGQPVDQRRAGAERAGPHLGRGEAAADGGTRLRVRDDGPGIPARIGIACSRRCTRPRRRGAASGLALCRRIMEAHGGTIELEASAAGASFLLNFPLRKADESPRRRPPA